MKCRDAQHWESVLIWNYCIKCGAGVEEEKERLENIRYDTYDTKG
jgi:hypothetical protein